MKVYQAEMQRPGKFAENILITTVAWIPDEHAVVGKLLDLKQQDGTWDGPWTVTRVYTKSSLDSAYVREHQRIDLPSMEGCPTVGTGFETQQGSKP